MNRTFHARIQWYHYFLLAIFTFNAVGALWTKTILIAVLMMLMLIFTIEWIIHTSYTVTPDNKLEIYKGRFSRRKVIPIGEITSVEQCHSMRFGSFSVVRYVLIGHGGGKYESLIPLKEQEFVELLRKRMELLRNPRREEEEE